MDHRQAKMWVAVACAVLVSACTAGPAARHGVHAREFQDSCVACHRTTEPLSAAPAGFAGGIDPSAACLDCHHYEENHHPVNVAPVGRHLRMPSSGLPLFDGKVRCLTCHQAHVDPGRNALNEPPRLLRNGPYQDPRQFCFQCHEAGSYWDLNPHRMLNGKAFTEFDGRQVCLFCHRETPDLEGGPDEVTFRADVAFLCRRCHAPMAGAFLDSHFHAKPKKKTRRVMRRTEEERDIALPLDRDGVITCSTCHNPHQEGVIARGPAAAGADQWRRLRVPKEQICGACHAA